MSVTADAPPPSCNALTIDVEDYFQVSAFAPYIARSEWDARECRVERNVERILEMLDEHRTQGDLLHPGLDRRALSAAGARDRRRRPRARKPRLRPPAGERADREAAFCADIERAKGAPRRHRGRRGARLPRAELFDRRRQPVGVRLPGDARATATAPASTRSTTITTACPMRRASRTASARGLLEIPVTTMRLLNRNLPVRRRRLFPAAAVCDVALDAAPGQRGGPRAGDLLLPPVGDRRRTSRGSPASTPRPAFVIT